MLLNGCFNNIFLSRTILSVKLQRQRDDKKGWPFVLRRISFLSVLESPLYTTKPVRQKSQEKVHKPIIIVMGSEEAEELESSSTPKLQLFLPASPIAHEPKRPWMVASPLHTAASVPFRWEEVPGKPRPCTTPINIHSQKCLELPPRLLMDAETAKLSSPSTVLDGPYIGRSRFQSTSFSLKRESFRKIWSPQVGKFGPSVLSNGDGKTGKGGFGSWRWGKSPFKGKCEVVVGNHVFPSSIDGESDINTEDDDESCRKESVKMAEMKTSGSYTTISSPARPHFWATVYDGLKKVVPWKTRKLRKDGMVY